MRSTRLRLGGCVVGLLGLASVVSAGTPVRYLAVAAAQSAGPVGEAQVVTLPYYTPAPTEARRMASMAGVAFVAPVIRAGFAGQFPGQDGTLTAGQGDELLFLSVDAYSFAPPFGQTGFHYGASQLTVAFADRAVALPESPDGTITGVAGSAYGDSGAFYSGRWVVAVPKGAPVRLTASQGGFSQVLDLRSGARVGPAPDVLYRAGVGPLALDLRPNLAGSLVESGGSDQVTFPVTVAEAVLTYFRLDSATPTAGLASDQAYLLVRVSVGAGSGQAGGATQYFFGPADPATALSVSASGGPAIHASFGPAFPGPGQNLDGVFGFVVPANTSSVTLTVGSGDGQSLYVEGATDVSPRAEPTVSSGPAVFTLRFPPPAPASVPPQGAAGASAGGSASTGGSTSSGGPRSTVVAPTATGTASPSTARQSSGGGSLGVGAAAGGGGVTLVVLGLVVWRRRTRLVTPTPVGLTRDEPSGPGGAASLAMADKPASAHPTQGPAVEGAAGQPPADDVEQKVLAAEPQADGPRLVVRVLGRLEVQGTTGVIRRRAVLRALVVLSVNHGRSLSSEELRGALAQDEMSEPSAATLRSELSRLRAVLPDGFSPERAAGSGYSLAGGIEVDWVIFKALGVQVRAADGEERLLAADRALQLVRGPVLENGGWHGIDKTVWEIEAAIETLATETATLALQAGQPSAAGRAAAQGLLAVPGSPGLWRLRLQAAEAGSGENAAVLAGRARSQLGG